MRLSLSRIVLDGHGGGCPSQNALMAAPRQRAVYGAPFGGDSLRAAADVCPRALPISQGPEKRF